MARLRTLLPALVALAGLGCASGKATAARPSLPPPAGDGRADVRNDRGAGPALASGKKGDAAPPAPLRPEVKRAVDAAQSLVGRREVVLGGRDYGPGCAAVVRAAFDSAGKPLPADARSADALLAVARDRGAMRNGLRCAPGDLVFLADRPGGKAAHVGLVTKVESDGTAVVVHRMSRGVARVRVNLGYPGRATDPATGKRLNDTLQVGKASATAGSLVVGVATLL